MLLQERKALGNKVFHIHIIAQDLYRTCTDLNDDLHMFMKGISCDIISSGDPMTGGTGSKA